MFALCRLLMRVGPKARFSPSTMALGLIASGALVACRCSGSMSGSVNDAGFSIGTPPSAMSAAPSASASSASSVRLQQGEHASGHCPPPGARSLTGTKIVGTECTRAEECSPICCECPSSSVSWLSAACVDGRCADRAAACSEPLKPGFCDQVHTKSTRTSHSNYRCNPKAGGKKAGEACEDAAECATTCCPCEGPRTWSASACINGACAPRPVTCAVAPMQDDFCGPAPSNVSRSARGEQKNERCPDPANELVGTAKAGQKCETAGECAPTCCECGNQRSWLGAACVNRHCASGEIACLESESSGSFCGRGCRGEGGPCWRGGECCSADCGVDHLCR